MHPEVLAKDFEFRAASEALEALYNRDELRQSYSGTIKQSAASSPCLVTAGLNGRSSAKAITGNPISVATNIASLTSPRSLLACRLQSLSRQTLPLSLRRRSAAQACNVLSADRRKCGQYRPIRRNARLARGIPGRLGNRIRCIHRLKRRSKGPTWPML